MNYVPAINMSALTGDQRPRISTIPPALDSDAVECLEWIEYAGYELLPWESFALASSLATTDGGLWAAPDVVIVAARQNGKTVIAEARMLSGIFILGEKEMTYTAHRQETALGIRSRMIEHLQSHRDLERKIQKIVNSHGEESILFTNGASIRFKTRSAGSGRGMTGSPLFLDEAYNLPDEFHGDMAPVVSATPNPQVWYMSSAADKAKHVNAFVLAKQRRRALAAMRSGEPDPSLMYMEWSAESGPDPERPWKDMPIPVTEMANARQANPSLSTGNLFRDGSALVTERTVANEARKLGIREYCVERLCIGFWPDDPDDMDEEPDLIPEVQARKHVVAVADVAPLVSPKTMSCLAADMSPDRRWVSIAAALLLPGGRIHVEIGRHEAPSRALTRDLLKLIFRWNPVAVVIDRSSGATSMLPELRQAGIEPELTTAGEVAAAAGGFYDDLVNGGVETLSFVDDPLLFNAFAASKKRNLAGGWALARNGSADISPFVAVTLARFGLLAYGEAPEVPSAPIIEMVSGLTVVDKGSLTSAFSSAGVDLLNDRF
jgi:hypothetical protein